MDAELIERRIGRTTSLGLNLRSLSRLPFRGLQRLPSPRLALSRICATDGLGDWKEDVLQQLVTEY